MQPDAIMLLVIAGFVFGGLLGYFFGKYSSPPPGSPPKELGYDADWWKRGDDPPEW